MTDKLQKVLFKRANASRHKRTDARVSLGVALNEVLHSNDSNLKRQVSEALRSGKNSRFTTEDGKKTILIVR